MNRWKRHMGYGFLPSLFLFYLFYSFYLVSQSFYYVFLFIPLLFLKEMFSMETVLSYLGFKWKNLLERSLLLFVYYAVFLYLFLFISSAFIQWMEPNVLFFSPFILLVLSELAFNQLEIRVLFIRLTPHVYIDLIDYQFHTREKIKEYDVDAILDDELNVEKFLHFSDYSLFRNRKLDITGTSSVHFSLESKKLLIFMVDSNGFTKEFTFTCEKDISKEIAERIAYMTQQIENTQ